MFINRDYSRTEHDDFVLNVEKRLDPNREAMPVYSTEHDESEGLLLGWQIQYRYE